MRTSFLYVAGVVTMLVAAPAAEAADARSLPDGDARDRNIARQCLGDLQTFDLKLARVGFGILPPSGYGAPSTERPDTGETPRQKIRALRNAASIEALRGNERSCRTVLSSMREIFEAHQKSLAPADTDLSVRTEWRRAHLARAEPMTNIKRLMRANIVIGADIRNLKDERLGAIQDIVLDPAGQTIVYVLVARGGFLGFGENLIAVPWTVLRTTSDHQIYVLDVSPKFLEQAPTVDRVNFTATADAQWQHALTRYWHAAGAIDR